jgi:hypothetical protein
LAGLIYGAWVDGASRGLVSFYILGFLVILAGAMWLANRRSAMATVSQKA